MKLISELSLAIFLYSGIKCFVAQEHFVMRHHLSATPFRTYPSIPIRECELECKSRKSCKAFNYRRYFGLCMLLDADSSSVEAVPDPRMVYSEKRNWKVQYIDQLCETCNDSDLCVLQNSIVTCVTAECGNPVNNERTVTYGNTREIGSKMVYVCNGSDVITREPVASVIQSKCIEGGAWSYPEQVTCSVDPPSLIEYKGCFVDDASRVLRDALIRNYTDMTVSYCAQYCYSTRSQYFGVEAGYACLCGSLFYDKGPSSACTKPCAGDNSEICGGTWAINIFLFKVQIIK